MDGAILRPGVRGSAAASLRDVVRYGFLLHLDGPESGWSEADGHTACRSAPQCAGARLPHDLRSSGEVLREHSLRVPDRVESKGIQTRDYARGAGSDREPAPPGQQHEWTTRPETGA